MPVGAWPPAVPIAAVKKRFCKQRIKPLTGSLVQIEADLILWNLGIYSLIRLSDDEERALPLIEQIPCCQMV